MHDADQSANSKASGNLRRRKKRRSSTSGKVIVLGATPFAAKAALERAAATLEEDFASQVVFAAALLFRPSKNSMNAVPNLCDTGVAGVSKHFRTDRLWLCLRLHCNTEVAADRPVGRPPAVQADAIS